MMYDGWVYIAKSDTGHYKIGRSGNPLGRVKHFDTIMPVEVKIIALIPCDNCAAAESLLHWQYRDYRHKGEWFDIPENMADRFPCLICFVEGGFIEKMDYGINRESGDGPANSCCVNYRDKLVNGGDLLWSFFADYRELPY